MDGYQRNRHVVYDSKHHMIWSSDGKDWKRDKGINLPRVSGKIYHDLAEERGKRSHVR